MNLLKTTSLSSIPTILKMITAVITNKIIAVCLGPAGVAFLGQYNNFFAMLGIITTAGISTGITKYIAEHRNEPLVNQRIIGTSIYLTLFATIPTTLIVIIGAVPISKFLFNDTDYFVYIIIAMIVLSMSTFSGICQCLWNAHQEIIKLIKRNVIAILISAAAIPIFVFPFGLKGAIIAGIASTIIIFVTLLKPLKSSSWFYWSILKPQKDKEFIVKLLKYSLMSLTSLVMVLGVQFFIRRFIGESLSYKDAGIWQGMVKISEMYLTVVTTSLSVYYLPKLASLKTNHEVRSEILYVYRLIVPLAAICSFALWYFRKPIITILYSQEFNLMESLFAFQMFGDFLKVCSWLIGTLMVAKAMTRYFIITEFVFGLLNVALHIFFVKKFGLIGAPLAYATLYFFNLVTNFFIFRNVLIRKKENLSILTGDNN